MAYKYYGKQTFTATVGSKEYKINCYGQGTRYGFRHVAFLDRGYTEEQLAKACYYNRTWERFTYETVLKSAIKKLPKEHQKELYDILIDSKAQKEHEETEKFLKDFEQAWNGLSEKNKEHIRNGIGDSGITTQEQADTVLFAAKMLNVFQSMEGSNN